MKLIKIVVTSFLIVFVCNVQAESKNEKLSALLEITGAFELAEQMSDALMQQLSPLFPAEAQPVLKEISKSLNFDELKGTIIELNAKHYTEAEVQAMLDFYSSAEGRSIIKKMPLVMQESMQLGNIYGRLQAKKIIEQMKTQGFEPKAI